MGGASAAPGDVRFVPFPATAPHALRPACGVPHPVSLLRKKHFQFPLIRLLTPRPAPGSATRVLPDVCVSLLEQVASPGDGPADALPGGPRRRFRWRQSSGVT